LVFSTSSKGDSAAHITLGSFPTSPTYLFAGLAVVAGHIWTLYHRFRGGGGISPALGRLSGIDPIGMLVSNLIAMFLGFVVFREFYDRVITAGTWLMIPWLWLRTGRWEWVLFALLINVMLVLATIPDISRYIRARRNWSREYGRRHAGYSDGSHDEPHDGALGIKEKDFKIPVRGDPCWW
jgi:glycerol-3-phosphate acyltransferase PlsY